MDKFENAPCRNNPALFDVTTWRNAAVALNDGCRVCPYRLACLKVVVPDFNWYDGVCGGVVWQNGKPLIKEYSHLHPLYRPYADFETLNEYLNWRKSERTNNEVSALRLSDAL